MKEAGRPPECSFFKLIFEIDIFLKRIGLQKGPQNGRISFLKASIFSREMLVLTYDLYFFPKIPDWDLWDGTGNINPT